MASQGPNNGNSFSNDTSIGITSWSSPSNAQLSDNLRSTTGLLTVQTTNYLKALDFGFSLIPNSVPQGILAEIEKSRGNLGDGNIEDASVRIVKNGVIQGDDKASGVSWPSVDTYAQYGGQADLWGLSWMPADFDVDFGVVIAARGQSFVEFGRRAQVDHIRVTLYFLLLGADRIGTQTERRTVSSSNRITISSRARDASYPGIRK